MKFFDENGEEYEYQNLYDEDGNQIGGFMKKMEDDIGDAFATSWLLGIFLLFISPFWGILYFLFLLIIKLLSFIFRIIWWLIRLPFCLIFKKELPRFKKGDYDDF